MTSLDNRFHALLCLSFQAVKKLNIKKIRHLPCIYELQNDPAQSYPLFSGIRVIFLPESPGGRPWKIQGLSAGGKRYFFRL